ncbi:hypothetical protein [Leucobacter sp. G161]|uniref:hypothetical protein n=1 Tax=Leucobacter sp. G161 TaxID=663704 RepID=UPI00073C934B|nr:hypothetical protein [Leucobacter sp. G161]KUF05540.1 hypothetical protein AUL38_04080 [Leucobacter sp. G161]
METNEEHATHAIDHTSRGFGIYGDFTDLYGEKFTIQESSLATEPCVWIGAGDNRGHLTVEMATHVRDQLTGWLQDVGAATPGRGREQR